MKKETVTNLPIFWLGLGIACVASIALLTMIIKWSGA
jgi:hypothetical protein